GQAGQVTVLQDGASVTSWVGQAGEGNIANVQQGQLSTLALSSSRVWQHGEGGNVGVYQNGTRLVSKVDQYMPTQGNLATVTQSGGGLSEVKSEVWQNSGSANKAYVTQHGEGMFSKVTQAGSTNLASVTQSTGDAESHIIPHGDNNSLILSQDGSGLYSSVTQNDNFQQGWVTQIGSGHHSTLTQGGYNNVATVTQTN